MDAGLPASHHRSVAATAPAGPAGNRAAASGRVLVPLLVGAVVSLTLGVYAREHGPTGRAVTTFGFSGVLNMKAWLTTVVVVLAVVQLVTALRIFGHLGSGRTPQWVRVLHRSSGTVAVVVSAPVAFHCLWSLGFSTFTTRTTVHSLLGCLFYGAFVAKLLSLKMSRLPSWLLPVLGGLVFATIVGLWLSSSLWFFRTVGFPEF
jgi:heme/copper-type cytochrome/quinol oxidase subunit 4